MKRVHLVALSSLLLIGVLTIAGCQDRTRISKILENPDRYANTSVQVAGRVTKTYGVNLIIAEAGAYQLDDGSGKIWVISKNGLPREGSEVGLRGMVSGGVKLIGQTFGTVIREDERKTRE